MAFSAHKDEAMMVETREPPEAVDAKATTLADALRAAKHVVVFTGAGISTSAGIADYRGPQGAWTLQAKGESHKFRSACMLAVQPTFTHLAIAELVRQGKIHHVISQNVDGLHRKSGVPKQQLSEIHGNMSIEYCTKCLREYQRDYNVQLASNSAAEHQTGRPCKADGCGGDLHDSIINFNDQIPFQMTHQCMAQSEQADLHIVLGSSLVVSPARDMPLMTKQRGGCMAIVNLQPTPLDADADIRVHSNIDEFMSSVMAHLGIEVPRFRLRRSVAIWRSPQGDAVCCAALDTCTAAPASYLRRCHVAVEGGSAHELQGDLDTLTFTSPLQPGGAEAEISITCAFVGHYGEPPVQLVLPRGCCLRRFDVSWDPAEVEGAWAVTHTDGCDAPSVDRAPRGFGGAATCQVTLADSQGQCQAEGTEGVCQWFAVQPELHCEHIPDDMPPADQLRFDVHAQCSACGNVGENMTCLTCHSVFCGRHVKGHMLEHFEQEQHPLVCGFVDLSFWCYCCEKYISPANPRLQPYYHTVHNAKHGVPPPRLPS